MKSIVRFPLIDRRVLLSSLAMLPLLSASLRSTSAVAQAQRDSLPSWNDGATKASILDFVARDTTQGGRFFVPVEQRIATFDNDGTLWIEQPMYIQLAFALDRVKTLAPMHPEWKTKQPFAAVLDNDLKELAASSENGLVEIIAVAHAGMTTAEFEKIVTDWLATARDQQFKRPYTELVYQPMQELLAYLRANGFRTFIVSGGGIEFMRPWTERIYGVPPEQVVGSSIKTRFELKDGAQRSSGCPKSTSSTTKPESRSALMSISVVVPLPPSATRRRSRNAAMDDARRKRPALWPDRPPHRCGARICLRPPFAFRQARLALDAAAVNRWTCGRHEEGLEAYLCLRLGRESARSGMPRTTKPPMNQEGNDSNWRGRYEKNENYSDGWTVWPGLGAVGHHGRLRPKRAAPLYENDWHSQRRRQARDRAVALRAQFPGAQRCKETLSC
jgi:hypothetical protein